MNEHCKSKECRKINMQHIVKIIIAVAGMGHHMNGHAERSKQRPLLSEEPQAAGDADRGEALNRAEKGGEE
jgi:cobalamin biosynthesis protein CbiG